MAGILGMPTGKGKQYIDEYAVGELKDSYTPFSIGGVEQEGYLADGINAISKSGMGSLIEDSARNAGWFGNVFVDTFQQAGKAIKGGAAGVAEAVQGGQDIFNANSFEDVMKGTDKLRKGVANVGFGIGGVLAAGPFEMVENIAFDTAMKISPEAGAAVQGFTDYLREKTVDWNSKYFGNTINDDNIDSVVGIVSVGAIAGGVKGGIAGIKAIPKGVETIMSALSPDAKKVLIDAAKDKEITQNLLTSGQDVPKEAGNTIEDNFNTDLGQTKPTASSFPITLEELTRQSIETGKQITGEQLTEAINNASEKKLPASADDVKVDIEWQRGEPTVRDEVNTVLDDSLGNITNAGKGITLRATERLMAVGLNEFEAASAIKKRIAENKELSRDKTKADTVPGAFETLRAMSWVRDGKGLLDELESEKSYSYDTENAPFASEAILTLEKAGIVDKRIVDGKYEFRLNEGAKRYISPTEYAKMTSGEGFKHLPVDLYESVKAKKVEKFSEESIAQGKAIYEKITGKVDNSKTTPEREVDTTNKTPTTNSDTKKSTTVIKAETKVEIPPKQKKLKLQDIDKELGRPKQDREGSASLHKEVLSGIDDVLVTKAEVPPLLKDMIMELGKRYKIDTASLFDYTGSLDEGLTLKFLDEMDKVKSDGYVIPTRLYVPNSLKTMLMRDNQVARDAFETGVKNQKEVDAGIISSLKEKMKDASEKMKKYYQDRIETINNRAYARDLIKKRIFEAVENLGTKGSPYKWYGDKKQIDNLVKEFRRRIEGVSNASNYVKVMDELEKAIEKRNIKSLKQKIEDKLDSFRRKQKRGSANKKAIDPQERMILETAATAWEDILKGANSETVKKYLDTIDSIIKVGKDKFEDSMKQKQEVIDNITVDIKERGLKNIFKEETSEAGYIKSFFQNVTKGLVGSPEFLYRIVNGDSNHPLWRLFSGLNNISNIVTSNHNRFRKSVIGVLDEAGLLTDETMQNMSKFMLTRQGDWNKNIYNKQGEFIGNNVFKGFYYATEADYLADIKKVEDFVEANPSVKQGVEFVRKLMDGTYEKANLVSILHTGVPIGRVDNYFSSKPIRDYEAPDYGDYSANKGFDRSFIESRNKNNNTYELDFHRDVSKFIDGELKYSEMLPAYMQVKDVLANGSLDGLNKETRDYVNDMLKEYSSSTRVESNTATQLSSLVGRNLLAGSLPTVLTQAFAIPEASLYASGSNLKKATGAVASVYSSRVKDKLSRVKGVVKASEQVLNGDLLDRAIQFSKALEVAFDFDYATAEAGNLAITNKFFRTSKKVGDTLLVPLSKADMATKYVVFLASYADKFKELTGKDFDFDNGTFDNKQALSHAEMNMQMAIGSKDFTQMPPVLKNSLGRVALMLQSFVARRYGQIFVRIPDEFGRNKSKASQQYAMLVTTTLAQSMLSPAWGMILASMGIREEKDFLERLVGKSDAEVDDIMFNIGKRLLTASIPGSSNITDLSTTGGTGLGVASAAKQFMKSGSNMQSALSAETSAGKVKERQYREAGIEAIGLIQPVFGGAPLRETKSGLLLSEKERQESKEYKREAMKEIAEYTRENRSELNKKAREKAKKKLEDKRKKLNENR